MIKIRFMKKHAGFTLIESLVVIAVLALLAALLFPVFSQAREKARQAVCLSNLKQIGAAFSTYVEEWDGDFPAGGLSSSDLSFWVIQLLPQLRSVPVFRCPSDPSDSKFSYLLNGWIFGGYQGERITLSDIQNP